MAYTPWGSSKGIGGAVRRRFGVPPRRPDNPPDDAVDVAFPGANRRTLRGWLFTAGSSRLPAVVVMHGWGSSAADMAPVGRMLGEAGFQALLLDARCHGRSDGDDFASMPRFAEDVEVAIAWLRMQPFVDPRRIALLGHSVGAGACLLAASRDPRVVGVVSVASMAHPAWFMGAALARQGVPRLLRTGALRYVEGVIGHRYDDFAPVRSINGIHCPILLAHGELDTTVPVSDAHLLQAAAPPGTELVVVPGAGHDDLEALQTVADRILVFLRSGTASGRR